MTLWQTLLRFDRTKLLPGLAARNTLGIVIPLVAGALYGNLPAGVVASLGALNVSYSDSREPYAARGERMFLASVLVGIAVAAGALAGHTALSAILLETLWAFAAGMLLVVNTRAGDLGAVTLMTVIVFAARPLDPVLAIETGATAFAGGLLQTLLSVAFWPLTRFFPERAILGELYRGLAVVAISAAGPEAAPPAASQISEAQEALSALGSDHSAEAEKYTFLLNQAERIRLTLLTLRRLRRRLEDDAAQAVQQILESASDSLASIGAGIENGKAPSTLIRFDAAAREFRRRPFGAPVEDARHQIDALAGQIRSAAGLAADPFYANVKPIQPAPRRLAFGSRLALLAANLSFHSTVFRHAIRLALCTGLGAALGRTISVQRAYWLPMTVAIILKPDFSATFSRGILRLGGTFAGLLLATGLFHFLHTGEATDIALLAIFAFAMRWLGPANYGVMVGALSALVVLLIAVTGVSPKEVIVARAVNTALGGALALIAYALWPTWERDQAGSALAEMLTAYKDYFHAVVELYAGSEPDRNLDELRSAGRRARSNAQALLDRIAAEPQASSSETRFLNSVLVSSHGFARAAMALESGLHQTRKAPPRPTTLAFAREAEAMLDAIEAALRGGDWPLTLPDLRAAHNAIEAGGDSGNERYRLVNVETDRIVNSLNTLREQVERWRSWSVENLRRAERHA